MDQQADRVERRLNIDFVMSVCALMISAVACATAFYQLRNAGHGPLMVICGEVVGILLHWTKIVTLPRSYFLV